MKEKENYGSWCLNRNLQSSYQAICAEHSTAPQEVGENPFSFQNRLSACQGRLNPLQYYVKKWSGILPSFLPPPGAQHYVKCSNYPGLASVRGQSSCTL